MKHIYLLAFFIITISNAAAQQVTFQKKYGGVNYEYGLYVRQTSDGGYIIAGNTNSFGAGGTDVYLIKTDANGNSLWTKTFGGSGDDWGRCIKQTIDSGYVILGWTNSFGAGNDDVYLIKTDVNGNSLWTKTFGETDADGGYSVQQTSDGGYIITGYLFNFSTSYPIVYLIKTDTNGNAIWSKSLGGTSIDGGYSVQQTTDGGFIITGHTLSFGTGNDDVYLIKTDSNGNPLWSKSFGGINMEEGHSVQQTSDGGYIITGITLSFGAGAEDIYLIKTDFNGDILWAKTIGGLGDDRGYSVQQTTDGGYIVTGVVFNLGTGSADVCLIKTDANGNSLWVKTFGGTGDDWGYSVQQTSDGGYIITGETNSFGTGATNVYLIKTDANGNSGCNQGNPMFTVTIPAIQITNPATIASSGGTVTNPNTLVGSGGIGNTLCFNVGIQSAIPNPQSAITISPNPATNNFTITFPNIINTATVSIYNIIGETIFKENITNTSRKEITLTGINAGIYFVKVSADGEQYTKKLVVQ